MSDTAPTNDPAPAATDPAPSSAPDSPASTSPAPGAPQPALGQPGEAATSAPAASSATSSIDPLKAAAQVAQIQQAQAAPAATPEPAVPDFPHWNEGQLVRHRWTDPYGDKEAYGLVLSVDKTEGAEDRVVVLWISSDRSGLIPASSVEDPSEDQTA